MVFEAQRGRTSYCDTALDNIVISEGACPCKYTHANTEPHTHRQNLKTFVFPSTACVAGCDFDTVGDLCGWVSEVEKPDVFGFDQSSGGGSSPGTGPNDDFSKPGCEFSFLSFIFFLQILKVHYAGLHSDLPKYTVKLSGLWRQHKGCKRQNKQ